MKERTWDTIETERIIATTKGYYLDIMNGVSVYEIVIGRPLFEHVDTSNIDYELLEEDYQELRENAGVKSWLHQLGL